MSNFAAQKGQTPLTLLDRSTSGIHHENLSSFSVRHEPEGNTALWVKTLAIKSGPNVSPETGPYLLLDAKTKQGSKIVEPSQPMLDFAHSTPKQQEILDIHGIYGVIGSQILGDLRTAYDLIT